jgi:hypothetical protein
LLGLPSEYKVRQLEKEGRLRPVRGAMGSAWYPRADVLALRPLLAGETPAPPARGREPSDAELLSLLRAGTDKTVVDLVIETGIGIARAQKIHRFWRTHERAAPPAAAPAPPSPERRAPTRLARAALIRQLRDPDPGVRDAAFEALKVR